MPEAPTATTYNVVIWGMVYRAFGPTFGIKGRIEGLDYQDVCEHIVNVSRAGDWIDVGNDQTGLKVNLGHFNLNS